MEMTMKIRVKIGDFEVDYEGPEDFLEEKLHKFVDSLSSFRRQIEGKEKGEKSEKGKNIPLPIFLKEKQVTTQVRIFLATAMWLHDEKGIKELKTGDVTKALRDNQRRKIRNPSDCLRQNINQGHCEKAEKDSFYVTDQGRDSIDHGH